MRRKIIDKWEVEARERTETLRQMLSDLNELQRVAENGSMDLESFAEYSSKVFNASIGASRDAARWFNGWRDKAMGRVSPQAEPAFQVFSCCLPLLSGSVQLYAESLTLGVISKEASDSELATHGIVVAKQVSVAALAMVQDTPALRRKHSPMVNAALTSVTREAPALAKLMPLVSERVQEVYAGSEERDQGDDGESA